MADKDLELGKIDDREASKQHLTSQFTWTICSWGALIMRRSDKFNFISFVTYVVLNMFRFLKPKLRHVGDEIKTVNLIIVYQQTYDEK